MADNIGKVKKNNPAPPPPPPPPPNKPNTPTTQSAPKDNPDPNSDPPSKQDPLSVTKDVYDAVFPNNSKSPPSKNPTPGWDDPPNKNDPNNPNPPDPNNPNPPDPNDPYSKKTKEDFSLNDGNKSKAIDEDEWKKGTYKKEDFTKVDANGDKYVTPEEFEKWHKKTYGPVDYNDPYNKKTKELFDVNDSNKSKAVDEDEWKKSGYKKEDFKAADANGDKYVTPDEFAKWHKKTYGPTDYDDPYNKKSKEHFDLYDSDKSKALNKEEWDKSKYNKADFEKADVNKDKYVSAEEFAKWHKKTYGEGPAKAPARDENDPYTKSALDHYWKMVAKFGVADEKEFTKYGYSKDDFKAADVDGNQSVDPDEFVDWHKKKFGTAP